MSLRKRLQGSRERTAQERAKRREERRRAERAKRAAAEGDPGRAEARRAAAEARAKRPDRAEFEPTDDRVDPAAKRAGRNRAPASREQRSATRHEAPKGEKGAKGGGDKRTPRPTGPSARRKTPRPARKGPVPVSAVGAEVRKVGAGVVSIGTELLKLGREMLVIPAQLWLGAAEFVGKHVLRLWRAAVRPALVVLWRALRASVAFAERQLTPARAVALVALVAAAALVASQWLDYHSVSVGVDAYSGSVGVVAPAPEVETEIAGHAHAWVMVPLAVLAIGVLGFALFRRPRAAALLVPIGVAVIAISLIVDLPKGLDEGTAAIAYDSVKASLLEGFWLQIAAAVVLIASGLMLPRYLRPASARQSSPELTGPSLFDSGAKAVRERAARLPRAKPRLRRPGGKALKPKRKVQGART